jgi:outer membrane protein TolC
MQTVAEARDIARQQLDLAHQDVSALMARFSEGLVPLRDVERARTLENQRWLAMYDAETQVERAKLAFLRQLGDLMASLRMPAETHDSGVSPKP